MKNENQVEKTPHKRSVREGEAIGGTSAVPEKMSDLKSELFRGSGYSLERNKNGKKKAEGVKGKEGMRYSGRSPKSLCQKKGRVLQELTEGGIAVGGRDLKGSTGGISADSNPLGKRKCSQSVKGGGKKTEKFVKRISWKETSF